MTLRADHVAGAAFVALGVAVIALSGDLPIGQLSMPGAGFMPLLVAVLMIVFGAVLTLRARASDLLASLSWDDLRHAGPVVLIAAASIALYTGLGFILTMILLMVALLVLVERRNVFRAGVYSVAVVLLAYGVFATFLKAPLPIGPLGF
jgi:putative tricarboxylic transport membrane protein